MDPVGRKESHYSNVNSYNDYVEGKSDTVKLDENKVIKLKTAFVNNVREQITRWKKVLECGMISTNIKGDSVYIGSFGKEMLNLLLYEQFDDEYALRKCDDNIHKALEEPKRNGGISFLNGEPGSVCIAAIMAVKKDDFMAAECCLERLVELVPSVCDKVDSTPDEILYGRAGFLYALLYARKHAPFDVLPIGFSDNIRRIIDAILESGKSLAARMKSRSPLMYMWHGKEYVGAAHGYVGILYMLLQARSFLTDTEMEMLVKPTVDYILSLKFESNNFPSSVTNTDDRLVQWCHGAPGVVFLMALAYEVFKDPKYLTSALDCGEVVWKRGLLKKGYSLCHGVAGNGYTFLVLYRLTKDIKHLHRATKFAEYCFDYGTKQDHKPDRPGSLYEGLAGVIYYLADILYPDCSRFPGFEL